MTVRTRNSLLAVAAAVACFAPVAAGATSPWAVKANAVCAAWSKKAPAIFGSTPTQPTTPKQRYAFLLKGRKIEAGILADLRRISLPRPAGADKALSLAAADLREINTLVRQYGAIPNAAFTRNFLVWLSDERAGRAFTAIGARRCA